MERKPRVSPLVPTMAIDHHLGRVHVGTSDAEVKADIEQMVARAAANDPRWTPALRRQAVKYALWSHHRNQAEYEWLMSGAHGRPRLSLSPGRRRRKAAAPRYTPKEERELARRRTAAKTQKRDGMGRFGR
jgi:hypothetical protein